LENLAIRNQYVFTREAPPRQKWSLTAAAFDKLLFCLDTDRDGASGKYLLLRRNLVRFFEGRAVAEAEEAADEVCNRLARKLDSGETIENIDQYAYGVARYHVLELRRAQAREQKMLSAIQQTDTFQFDEQDETELRLESLSHCLNELSYENRELILTYYRGGEGSEKIEVRRRLAEKLGIPPNALRCRAVRLRERLKFLMAKNLKKQTI
jgi:DNA-directed RNA polymerase specialized sigma24 family protein